MNILMVTEKDAANVSLAKIAAVFLNRGHKVRIFALYISENVLYMFDKSIRIDPFETIKSEDIESADIVFSSVTTSDAMAQKGFFSARKIIFTQNYLIDKQLVYGGDICFIPSFATTQSDYELFPLGTRIAVGDPKYDTLDVECKQDSKTLLFIDSGHYPFGYEAKKELAKTLIHICNRFPDYRLVVKPRFLPSDSVRTHYNKLYLYDVIKAECNGCLPNNFVWLTEHYDLPTLISECHTVICMYTTAFTGAYAKNKGLVILDGLPSEDNYDIRNKLFSHIRDNMLPSGALVDYKHVETILPHGVKCTDKYLKFLLEETDHVADKICSTVEFIYDNLTMNHLIPKSGNYTFKNFSTMCPMSNLQWNDVVKMRYRNYFFQKMISHIDYRVSATLKIEKILNYDNTISPPRTKNEFFNILKESNIIRYECISENHKIMRQDIIDAGILLNAYYILQEYEKICSFSLKNFGAYFMFRGFVAYEIEKDDDYAMHCLKKYLKISMGREYIVEISDMSNNRMKAFFILNQILFDKHRTDELQYFYKLMHTYYDELYGNMKMKTDSQKIDLYYLQSARCS